MVLAEDFDAGSRAEVEGEAAKQLANIDVKLARQYLERCVQRSLSDMPEGSADTIRGLWASLLAENGRFAEATEVAVNCDWASAGTQACADIIPAIPADDRGG